MRQAGKIWDTWDNGSYVGNNRSHGRVTVEPEWVLHSTTGKNYLGSNLGPFRWYQDTLNDQAELEIPNVKSISIDRSLDTDIASSNIEVYNQWMDTNGAPPNIAGQLGKPGFFSWGHGASEESVARWNQATNSWEDVLLPNALLRTYEGYGGYNTDGTPMHIRDAQAIGALVLTGAWLVDEVILNAQGIVSLKCRDVGKLLGVQQYFPPLVPENRYMKQWVRWIYKNIDAKFNPRLPQTSGKVQDVAPKYLDSSADRWYGYNADIHGHRALDSLDANTATYAMSVGNYHPSKLFCADWWEYGINDKLNEVYVNPWAGNYTMYVSVMENGVWQTNDEGLIPYSADELFATQDPAVDTGANIPYVMKVGVPWETAVWYQLPRTFSAEKIRITFRDHTLTEFGPWLYRCGIRELMVRVNTVVTSPPADPWNFSMAIFNNPDFGNEVGYWCVADDGQVFAFGDAREHAISSAPVEGTNTFPVNTIRGTTSGQGYWIMQLNGHVVSFGDAAHFGDALSLGFSDFFDMAITPTGAGYWLLRRNGEVHAFGDAVHHGNATPSGVTADAAAYTGTGIESHPTIAGYWIVDGDGQVQDFGGVPHYGGIAPYRTGLKTHEWVRGIRRNSTGTGYWIVGGSGLVYNKGAAADFGQAIYPSSIDTGNLYDTYRHLVWTICPTVNDDGWYVMQANGDIFVAGAAQYLGAPGQGGQIREDGNYRDYADIVKALLAWAGFLYYSPTWRTDPATFPGDESNTPNFPPVYGNIENTGTYSDTDLPLDTFDKKTIIDCINKLKEIVGYIFYIDPEGAARFESPNWWSIGNFWIDGTPTDFIPELDERTVLTDYSVVWNDDSLRSEIIISTEQPQNANKETVTTRFVPNSSSVLRGIVKPAMWINGLFKNKDEQDIMAELIALHIWFAQRTGSVTAIANPCIGINDQVRIFERTTSETYVHYVRSMTTSHDLDTGQYMMNLNTHWMGDEDNWAITREKFPTENVPPSALRSVTCISDKLMKYIEKSTAQSIKVARLNNFGTPVEPAKDSYATPPPAGGSGGAANG